MKNALKTDLSDIGYAIIQNRSFGKGEENGKSGEENPKNEVAAWRVL